MGNLRKLQKNHKRNSKGATPSRVPDWIMAISAVLMTLLALVALLIQSGANVLVWIISITAFLTILVGLVALVNHKGWL